MKIPRSRWLLAFQLLLAASCPVPPSDDLTLAASLLTGSFSSEFQAKTMIGFSDYRMRATRVWANRTDGVWLYIEQAKGESVEKPYRQRVYHFHYSGSLLAISPYKMPLAEAFMHKGAVAFDLITPSDLDDLTGCEIYLARIGVAEFKGSTSPKSCKSTHEGASYMTTTLKVSMYMIVSWDHGHAENGTQVWGPELEPYEFRRTGLQ